MLITFNETNTYSPSIPPRSIVDRATCARRIATKRGASRQTTRIPAQRTLQPTRICTMTQDSRQWNPVLSRSIVSIVSTLLYRCNTNHRVELPQPGRSSNTLSDCIAHVRTQRVSSTKSNRVDAQRGLKWRDASMKCAISLCRCGCSTTPSSRETTGPCRTLSFTGAARMHFVRVAVRLRRCESTSDCARGWDAHIDACKDRRVAPHCIL